MHGTPHEASTSFLPETLVDGVAMLRAHGISACACLVGGPEDAKGNFLVDMEFARMYQAIVAETGGTVGERALECGGRLGLQLTWIATDHNVASERCRVVLCGYNNSVRQ